jgi:hypothetical protein
MQVTAYVGLRIRGAAGTLAAFAGFGLPAFILMMVPSALYVSIISASPGESVIPRFTGNRCCAGCVRGDLIRTDITQNT